MVDNDLEEGYKSNVHRMMQIHDKLELVLLTALAIGMLINYPACE